MVSVGARPVCKEQQQHHHARRGRRDHGTRPRLVHRSTSKLASWSPSNSDMLTSNFMVNWDGFDYGTLYGNPHKNLYRNSYRIVYIYI